MSHDGDEPEDDWFDELVEAEAEDAPVLAAATAARVLATVHAVAARGEAPGEGAWPDVMTPAEVAAYLRVTPAELELEIAGMPFFEFAGRLRIRRAALEEWVEGREKRLGQDRLLAVGDDRGTWRSE
jgi:hypothetical protein